VALICASQELASAKRKATQGTLTDKGAPHVWDEGRAFLYGVDGTSSVYKVPVEHYTGVDVVSALASSFNEGLTAVQSS